MRISDWSSDVCSSDLTSARHQLSFACLDIDSSRTWVRTINIIGPRYGGMAVMLGTTSHGAAPLLNGPQRVMGRGRSEERRLGKGVSVRVDIGGRRIIKKKHKQPKQNARHNTLK